MSGAHADVSRHVRTYLLVFGALVVGTVLTVLASTYHFGGMGNLVIAVSIACVKASLVAAIFMHLKWERSISIWWALFVCAIFFAVLMLLPVLSASDQPPGVLAGSWEVMPPAAPIAHEGNH